MHIHVVVNAQFEDRIRARICAADCLKRAALFVHQIEMATKKPKGGQRLPDALVFCDVESQMT